MSSGMGTCTKGRGCPNLDLAGSPGEWPKSSSVGRMAHRPALPVRRNLPAPAPIGARRPPAPEQATNARALREPRLHDPVPFHGVAAGKEITMTDQMSDAGAPTPVFDVLAAMTAASLEQTGLDPQTLLLVRLAALVAGDAPPLSYALNLRVAGELGVSTEQIESVLAAVAPVVGTLRVVAAAGNILRAVGIAIAVSEEPLAEGTKAA